MLLPRSRLGRPFLTLAMVGLFAGETALAQLEPRPEIRSESREGGTEPMPAESEEVPATAETPPALPAIPTDAAGGEPPAAGDGDSSETPTASFDPVTAPTTDRTPREAADEEGRTKLMSFNFRYAPWAEVLKLFADTAGLTLDLNDVPPGTFNYYDNNRYTPTEALDVLNGYLLQKGYILVRRDQFLVSLNIDNGIPPNLVPNVDVKDLPARGKNELLSVVLPLEGMDAEQAATEIASLVGPQGKVTALKSANSLAVTDIGSNLRRIADLLKNVTARGNPDELLFRAFFVKHVPAADAERLVRNLLGLNPTVVNVSSSSRDRSDRDRGDRSRSRWGSRDRDDSPPPTPASSETAKNATVTSDARTNRLLVTATAAQMETVEKLLEAIDIGEDESGRPFAVRETGPHLRVYEVNSSDPREVTKTLDAMMPGVVVNEDGRNRKIHIFATADEHREVEQLIRQLDGAAGTQSVTVIPLSELDPIAATGTLRSLFAGDGDAAPTIEADTYGRRLLIRGTPEQLVQVRTLLSQLGEDGTGLAAANRPRGPVRMIPLGGRDPQEFLPLIEKFWTAGNGGTPIRIVVPSKRGPIRERLVPSAEDGSVPLEQETDAAPVRAGPSAKAGETRGAATFLTSADEDAPAADVAKPQPAETQKPTAPPARETESKPPVAVSVSGDTLILTSEDEAALDRMETLIEKLAQAVPPKMTWTVFYLRAADALETATMLEQLFPASSVDYASSSDSSGLLGGLTTGVSSFSSSLMDVTGLSSLGQGPQTLRIIPELRSNALFVSGPADKVQDVEQVLQVLDASELPDSLRDRLPRMIPVEHADVEEVATIVREVYRDYLGNPNNGGDRNGRGGNPLAMLMGGGDQGGNGRGGRRQQQPEVRLTVGVDSRTSQLIISANDQLFQEIEGLVERLDQSAQEANRTVRVVPLDGANTYMIQQALGSVLPKVKVSTTRSRTGTPTPPTTPSTTQQPQQQSSGDDAAREQMRQLFELRMRERMQQGGDDGGRGFRRGSSDEGRGSSRFGGGRSGGESRRGRGR